jgi:hypothetical protein
MNFTLGEVVREILGVRRPSAGHAWMACGSRVTGSELAANDH